MAEEPGDQSVAVPPAEPADLRLLPAAALAWVAAWSVPALPPTLALGMAGAAGVLALACAPLIRRPAVAVTVAALIVGAAAGVGAAARVAEVGAGPIRSLAADRATATVDLRITGDPRIHRHETRFGSTQQVVSVPARASRVIARGATTQLRTRIVVLATDPSWVHLIPGQQLRASGRFGPARPRTPTAAVLRVQGAVRDPTIAPWRDRAAADVRAGLRSAVAGLGADERGLVPGLVLGDTSGISAELTEDFRITGLSHVLAVSGSNLALLLGAVLGAARWAGVRLRALPLLGLVVVVGFVFVARPEPSLLRASVMGLVGVWGLAAGRRGRAAPALFAAIIVLLFVDPWLARAFGFALSVAATAALIFLAPRWSDALSRWLPRPAAVAVAVPAAAQTACAPIIVLFADEVSLVAVPANVLAIPAVPAAMLLGVVAAVSWPVCPPLARAFGELAGLPAWWIVTVARASADLPAASVPWPTGLRGALALAGITVAVVGVLCVPRTALVALLAGALLLQRPATVDLLPWFGTWPPADWRIVACDVGQGDAVMLRAGPRSAVVVDTGAEPGPVDGCLRRLGVRTVPYLVLTHFHADHVGGLAGVLRGRQVAEIAVSPLDDPPAAAATVRRTAARAGIPVSVPAAGERREVGDLSWRVLWPRRLIDDGAAANNASIVLLAQFAGGPSVLLTGDVEPAAQAALLRAEPGLRAEVLKVPHHGSSHQMGELLTSLGARVALVSVGEDNDYGHPAPAILRLLEVTGARVARTDQAGDLALISRGSGLSLVVRGRRTDRPAGPAAGQACLACSPCDLRPRPAARADAGVGPGGAAGRPGGGGSEAGDASGRTGR